MLQGGVDNDDKCTGNSCACCNIIISLLSTCADVGGLLQDMVDHIDLNWSDFMFNLISMCIVYAYFSKAAGPHESITAVLLCMAVAAFDILLLLLRWLWCVLIHVFMAAAN